MNVVKYCSAIAIATVCLLPGVSDRAYSQQQLDYACFVTTSSGNTVDFSQTSLCGTQKSAPKVPVNTDEAFLAEYKRNVMQYAEVRDNLLANAQQSPQVASSQAQRVCNDLKSGLSLDQIKQKQATETVEQSSIVNAQIITDLATKYYCPNASK